ncbi:MAG: valine--tRNA ligase, partial [Candidatus Aminicenantes bacterium]|nr:valine--tRNA ligase [Candidatus Aminicenantes bacterium]
HGLPPGKKLDAVVRAAGRGADVLRRMEPVVVHLAGLASLRVGADVQKPAAAVVQVLSGAEIYLTGLVDPAKERERLTAQRSKLADESRKIEAKLANPGFVERAPAEVVAKERRRLADLSAQIAQVDANLKALGG